jgi:mannose/fructose/N-acetylgalactosamine-specific phosphotransferase system component IID
MEVFNFENYVSELHLFKIEDLEEQKKELEYKMNNFIYEPYLCEKIAAVSQELEERYNNGNK